MGGRRWDVISGKFSFFNLANFGERSSIIKNIILQKPPSLLSGQNKFSSFPLNAK